LGRKAQGGTALISLALNKTRAVLIGLAVLLLVPFVVYLATSVHIRLMADDFCVIESARRLGIVENSCHYYQSWMGSLVVVFAMSLQGFWGSGIQSLITGLILISWWLLSWAVVRWLLSRRTIPYPGLVAAVATFLLCLSVLGGSPTLVQSLYWMNGRIAYFSPVVLMTLVVCLILYQPLSRFPMVASLMVLGVVIGNGAISYSLAFTIVVFLASFVVRGERRKYVAVAFAGSVIGMLLMISAPGNAIRQSNFPEPDLLNAILATLTSPAFPGVLAFRFSPVSSISAVVVPLLFARYFDDRPVAHSPIYIVAIPILIAIVVAACYAPAYYATSNALPPRVFVLPLAVTFGGFMVWGYVVGIATRRQPPAPSMKGVWLVVFLLVATGVVAIVQSAEGFRRLETHAAQYDARDLLLRNSASEGESNAVVPAMSETFWLDDLSDDTTFWVNQCVAAYYGLETVRTP
jgi:hypothetical protein